MCFKKKQNDGKQVTQEKETVQENQDPKSEQPVQTAIGNPNVYESCIEELTKKLTKRKRMIIVGYVLLMILLLYGVVRVAGVLTAQKELLGDVLTVVLICAVSLVFSAVVIWIAMKLLMLTQRYQTVINRLEILQTRLRVGTTEASKKALVNQELKMVTRILGELGWKQWYGAK